MNHILETLEEDMENRRYLKDEELEDLFRNRIIQHDNFNSNSELFKYGDIVLKIYNGDSEVDLFNKRVISNIFNMYSYLKDIGELVLPKDILIYNGYTVGFSMPYIEGKSLEEIINQKIDYDMKSIFIRLLDLINRCKKLPFDFCIGDMHEKNIIIDNDNNIRIIDADSFIIDNNKLFIDGRYILGKYANHYFNDSQLERIKNACDYHSLLCIILNYLFKGIIEDVMNPVAWLKEDSQFEEIYPILDRVDENFILNEEDIYKLFEFKNRLNYKYIRQQETQKEIDRIRRVLKKH